MISKKMNEKILDGALTLHKKYLSGSYKGYYITIDYKPPVYIVYIHATFDNLPGKAQFESFLEEHQSTMQYLSKAEAKQHTVKLRIIEPKPKKLIPSVLNDTIDPVITQLLRCKYDTGCINCGDNDGQTHCYEISGYHHYICEECVKEIEKEFKEKQIESEGLTSNVPVGTIGAIGGSLIGVIAWIVLSANNLFAWIAGVAILFLVYKGYEMLGGRVDKKGFIICTVLAAIMIPVANHLAWVWSAMDLAKKYGYSMGQTLLLWPLVEESNATVRYILDILLGYFSTFIIGFKIVKGVYRRAVSAYSIKKCE